MQKVVRTDRIRYSDLEDALSEGYNVVMVNHVEDSVSEYIVEKSDNTNYREKYEIEQHRTRLLERYKDYVQECLVDKDMPETFDYWYRNILQHKDR